MWEMFGKSEISYIQASVFKKCLLANINMASLVERKMKFLEYTIIYNSEVNLGGKMHW